MAHKKAWITHKKKNVFELDFEKFVNIFINKISTHSNKPEFNPRSRGEDVCVFVFLFLINFEIFEKKFENFGKIMHGKKKKLICIILTHYARRALKQMLGHRVMGNIAVS